MLTRLLAGGLVVALAALSAGCGCCHSFTRSSSGAPCCPPGTAPVVAPPAPPAVSGFPPTGHPATFRR